MYVPSLYVFLPILQATHAWNFFTLLYLTLNHNVANLSVKEQPFDQPESSFQDENDNDTNLQEPEIDLQKNYSTCCNEKDPLEDATTTTTFSNELPLWPEGQVLVNCNSNHDVSNISIKEESCDQDENIDVDQDENGEDTNWKTDDTFPRSHIWKYYTKWKIQIILIINMNISEMAN